MPPEVLILDVTPAEDADYISRQIPQAKFSRAPSDATIISVAWTNILPGEYPSLRCIVNRSMGRDHVDRVGLEAAGVKVLQIGDYCSDAIAAYVWERLSFGLPPKSTICVVGLGRIGQRVASLLRGRYRVVRLHHSDWEWDISTALHGCAGVTLHLPLTPQSRHWLNVDRARYLDNAVLVNTARAGLVVNKALVWGLSTGHIKRAYIDVGTSGMLMSHPQVEMTAHIAHLTPASKTRRAELTVALLEEALDEVHVD